MQKTVRKYKCGESTGRRTKKILEALTLDEMFDKFIPTLIGRLFNISKLGDMWNNA